MRTANGSRSSRSLYAMLLDLDLVLVAHDLEMEILLDCASLIKHREVTSVR